MAFLQVLANKVVDGYGREAVEELLERCEDDAYKLYNYWGLIRSNIYRDESNRSPTYHDEMLELMQQVRDPGDREKMVTVSNGTLQFQHRIHNQKKAYLKDKTLNRLFKEIRPLVADFYDFVLPEGSAEAYTEEKHRRRIERQETEHGKVSSEKAEAMLTIALDVLMKPPVCLQDVWNILASLLLVSGRRQYELLVTIQTRRGDNDYLCYMKGLSKVVGEVGEVLVPLLCQYDLFKVNLDLMRSERGLLHYFEKDRDESHSELSGNIAKANHRLFGHLTHSTRRNIYVELAWRRRLTENFFMNGCSKGRFAQKALGHTGTRISDIQVYQAFSLDDDTADIHVN